MVVVFTPPAVPMGDPPINIHSREMITVGVEKSD